MTYAITYRNVQTNETHTVDWAVPDSWGWSTEQVRDSFQVRFTNSILLKIEPCS
jgi:hypothetical protein